MYYWGPRLSPFRAGHLSIQLEDGTYISFWPGEEPSGIAFGKKFQATTHETYGQDAEAEGGDADDTYQVDGLDEAAIKEWWEKEKQNLSIGQATNARTRSAMRS